ALSYSAAIRLLDVGRIYCIETVPFERDDAPKLFEELSINWKYMRKRRSTLTQKNVKTSTHKSERFRTLHSLRRRLRRLDYPQRRRMLQERNLLFPLPSPMSNRAS
uniref:Uncharacterized protein n=1 Tax=Parascaris univalens TaxID=6257 RepID=A0A915AQU2_PARUN